MQLAQDKLDTIKTGSRQARHHSLQEDTQPFDSVMIDTASRNRARDAPSQKKTGTREIYTLAIQHSLTDIAVSDWCLSHVAKSNLVVDTLSSVKSEADHKYALVPRPSRRQASRATPIEREGQVAYHVIDCHITQG